MALDNSLILWGCERNSYGKFPDRKFGKLAHNLSTQLQKTKTRVALDRDILNFLKSSLNKARVEIFIDWFYDTPKNELLGKGPWLLRREWFDPDTKPPLWKLRVMVNPNPMEWVECQTENAIIRCLQESDIGEISVSSLPGPFPHIYLDVYTKRYHLYDGLWIDFVGWYPYEKHEDAAVYAVCSAEQPLQPKAQLLFDEIKSRSTSGGYAPSKTLVMLAHANPKLFSEIFKYDPSHLFESVHSGVDFADFDHYLGQEQGWTKFPISDDEDDQAD